MRPFSANEELENLFFKAFDGLEVLPALAVRGIPKRYVTMSQFAPESCLVPISWRKVSRSCEMTIECLPRELGRNRIVLEPPYGSEVGLTFRLK